MPVKQLLIEWIRRTLSSLKTDRSCCSLFTLRRQQATNSSLNQRESSFKIEHIVVSILQKQWINPIPICKMIWYHLFTLIVALQADCVGFIVPLDEHATMIFASFLILDSTTDEIKNFRCPNFHIIYLVNFVSIYIYIICSILCINSGFSLQCLQIYQKMQMQHA